jgi:hypothetical protein
MSNKPLSALLIELQDAIEQEEMTEERGRELLRRIREVAEGIVQAVDAAIHQEGPPPRYARRGCLAEADRETLRERPTKGPPPPSLELAGPSSVSPKRVTQGGAGR